MPEGTSEAVLPPDCFRNELSKASAEATDNPAGINHQGKLESSLDALAVEDGDVPQTSVGEGKATIEYD